MQLEVGPVEAQQVQAWTKCMRRLLIELRVSPDRCGLELDADLLAGWGELTETWAEESSGGGTEMHWISDMESDKAEFLLYGLLSVVRNDFVRASLTEAEINEHRPFTLHIIDGFIEGLSEEGKCDQNYLEHVRSGLQMESLGS